MSESRNEISGKSPWQKDVSEGLRNSATRVWGYARVSDAAQNPARQTDALEGMCDVVVLDRASGKNTARPGLQRILTEARPGDRVEVTSLDRLGRSVRDVLSIIDELTEREVAVNVHGVVDTGTPTGRLMVTVLGAVAEMELALIHERQAQGIAAAKARGVHMGRPAALSPEQVEAMAAMRTQGASYRKLAAAFGVSVRTAHRAINGEAA